MMRAETKFHNIYEIVRKLGGKQDGLTSVYLARDVRYESGDIYVALKALDKKVLKQRLHNRSAASPNTADNNTKKESGDVDTAGYGNPAIQYENPAIQDKDFDFHTQDFLQRFRQEPAKIKRLDHPNIVRIEDAPVETDEYIFFTMKYLDGICLSEYVKKNISLAQKINIIRQIAEGVKHSHRNGIIHRDLKPENVIVIENENDFPRAVVIDFGIAFEFFCRAGFPHPAVFGGKRISRPTGWVSSAGIGVPALQNAGLRLESESQPYKEPIKFIDQDIAGTPHYMAPEQFLSPEEHKNNNLEINETTDIYGLGAVLYFLVTGEKPFQCYSLNQIIDAHSKCILPSSPKSLNPSLTNQQNDFILKSLNKRQNERQKNVAEFLVQLDSVFTVIEPVYQETEETIEFPDIQKNQGHQNLGGVFSLSNLLRYSAIVFLLFLIFKNFEPFKTYYEKWTEKKENIKQHKYIQHRYTRKMQTTTDKADTNITEKTVRPVPKRKLPAAAKTDLPPGSAIQPQIQPSPVSNSPEPLIADTQIVSDRGSDVDDKLNKIFQKGNEALRESRLQEARNAYNILTEEVGEMPEIHNNIGIVYLKEKDYANALKEFEKALQLNPDFSSSIYNKKIVSNKIKETF